MYVVIILLAGLLVFVLGYAVRSFSYVIAVPVVKAGHVTERGLFSLVHSKSDLLNRIETLESENAELTSKLISYSLIENENSALKNSVFAELNGIVAGIVGKPGKSEYDTLLIDPAPGIHDGMRAYTIAGVSLGKVTYAAVPGATVTLHSSPGIETDADIILNDAMQSVQVVLRGRGGGAYEAIVPTNVAIPIGSLATIPGLFSKPVAEVVKIVTRDDTKDQIIYLRSVVNFQYLRYIILVD